MFQRASFLLTAVLAAASLGGCGETQAQKDASTATAMMAADAITTANEADRVAQAEAQARSTASQGSVVDDRFGKPGPSKKPSPYGTPAGSLDTNAQGMMAGPEDQSVPAASASDTPNFGPL